MTGRNQRRDGAAAADLVAAGRPVIDHTLLPGGRRCRRVRAAPMSSSAAVRRASRTRVGGRPPVGHWPADNRPRGAPCARISPQIASSRRQDAGAPICDEVGSRPGTGQPGWRAKFERLHPPSTFPLEEIRHAPATRAGPFRSAHGLVRARHERSLASPTRRCRLPSASAWTKRPLARGSTSAGSSV